MARAVTAPAVRRTAVAWFALAALAVGVAQDLTGTYATQVEGGTITVELAMQGERFNGSLRGPGVQFALEGWIEDGTAVGVATSVQGALGFEALVDGDTLGMWFYEVVDGAVVPESEIEVILQRVSSPTAGAPTAPVGQAAGGLAPPVAPAPAGGPAGTPPSQPRKQLPGNPPVAQGESPAPQGGLLPPTADSPAPQQGSAVIATGAFGSLTQDDAVAFIEALEFVLAQIGYAYTFTDAERGQAYQAIAQNYPQLSQTDQVVLSQARDIWERVRAGWATATLDEQREFAVGVLVLAFGEQTVSQWAGSSTGQGGGACTTFEDCTGNLVDGQSWGDTFNAQSCWAAAGCNSFDASTGTFDYDSDY
ncbi:MAG TPA: hypothetical protein VF164_02010 [Trueperaceae bacterium]